MVIRALALCVVIPLLIAATNSSQSSFSVTFPSGAASTELVSAAVAALKVRGFEGPSPQELQYRSGPLWVSVTSPTAGELALRFTQLRGGCGNHPEVDGAVTAVDSVRQVLEGRFGPSATKAIHRANALSQ
jgi:hypothetical protein